MSGGDGERHDFFISRAGANNAFAIWLAALLRAQGRSVFLQDTDFESRSFLDAMHEALKICDRTIAIYSPAYFASEYCKAEWQAVLGQDFANRAKRLVPFMLEACAPEGLLGPIGYKPLMEVRRRNDSVMLAREILAWLGLALDETVDIPAPPEGTLITRLPVVDRRNIHAQPDFAGREDLLAEIARRVGSGSATLANARQAGISGLGGVGKSTLAREFAWRFQDGYEGVWWVRADTPDNVVADLAELGARLSPALEALKLTRPDEAARRALEQVEAPTERPWLIVYDNVEAMPDFHAHVPRANAHVLLTTRQERLYGAGEAIDVGVLPPDVATDYLLTRTQRSGEAQRAAAAALAADLGHLPLALDHAAALCADSGLSFEDYRAHLGALLREKPETGPSAGRYPDSVYGTFTLAIERVAQACPPAERLMGLAAFLAPDRIPLALIDEQAMPTVERARAVAALVGVSLIERHATADDAATVSVHRLVQVVMQARLAAAGKAEATAAAVGAMVARGYVEEETFAGLAANARWLPHALAAVEHAPVDGPAAWSTLWTHLQIGDTRRRLGDLGAARASYEVGLDIATRLAASDPDNAGWQRDLSVSHNKIGDVLVGQGNMAQALDAFNASLAIRERLAMSDPGNAGWQRDLSVSHNKIGDVLVGQGNLAQALDAFNASLAIRERLAKSDPGNAGWQRDLSVSHNKIGDVLVGQGNLAQALEAFNASLAIIERLAKSDPGNAGWQRDLSVSQEKIGDVLVGQGNLAQALDAFNASLAIRERLAKSDQANAGWQRDLSVSHNKIGDVLVGQGNLAQALDAFNASLVIIERLAKSDPGNAGWQRDLSVSQEKIGEVLVGQGNLAQALDAFNASLAIAERLAKSDQANAGWQADLAASHGKIGQLHVELGRKDEALRLFRAGRAIVAPFAEASGHRTWLGYLRSFDRNIAALEAADEAVPVEPPLTVEVIDDASPPTAPASLTEPSPAVPAAPPEQKPRPAGLRFRWSAD